MSVREATARLRRRSLPSPGSRWHGALPDLIGAAGLVAMIADTAAATGSRADDFFSGIVGAAWAYFVVAYGLRVWLAPEERAPAVPAARARREYVLSANGTIDLLSALALPAGWLWVDNAHDAQIFAVVWVLRYLRRSSGLSLLWRVFRRALPALVTVVTVFLVTLLIAATLAYVFERRAQPQVFGSIPQSLWWAIVTLSTTGYGDVVPATIWGRLLAAWVMVAGIVLFALWAGIIANAFGEELQRRHFLNTWDLVAEVPFFRTLGAAAIADIVNLLHPRDAAAGAVVVREGQAGDSMYFIVSGEATAMVAPEPVVLGPGAFFGEMALLYGTPRSTTVVATKPSVLLVLDVADFRLLAGRRPELVTVIEEEGRRRRELNLGPPKA